MAYRTGFERFRRHGEAFFIVSPSLPILMVANAEVLSHIATHREKFPKWTTPYAILRQFGGENVITSEGQVWRMHRKVTSASFNERNAAVIFREAIVQTQGMLRTWMGPTGVRKETLHTVDGDTMRLALNIIGYVGFGLRLLWPGQTLPAGSDPRLVKYASLEAPAGHKMSFADTMAGLMENIMLLLLAPKWLLRALPSKRTRLAADAYEDYVKYMDEMMEEKMEEARKGDGADEGMDLMGHLVQTTYKAGQGGSGDNGRSRTVLNREEIISNAFIMFVAGHETTANVLHFAMVQLATNPAAQRRLQRDLDELVGTSDPASWDYGTLLNPLMASMAGACMYETMRILPPVTEMPKTVTVDQPVDMDGRRYVVPKDTVVSMVAVSAHHNPRYWPHAESRATRGQDDLRDFKPERWFQTSASGAGGATDMAGADAGDYGGYEGPDTSPQLFRPERGAYIPFSDGARSCLGRRIAQVEMVAALAVVFREHSLELAVDEWASEEETAAMGRDGLREVYGRAQQKSLWTMRQARNLLTLKLHGGVHVPLRVVRRGGERFVGWMEDS
ncbi:Cytochrome P450 [Tolypocladium capitatum]|uniref:Cytochrome P450 n=1 Tax=Tolypocladium capitatum TaxID=45235 RepID=A0A2K3QQS6_9HYPO|nr:Cytochrome P450 [Tolypocladium capitatum]